MKTIFYLIITSLICITLASAAQKTTQSTKNVILQASDIKATSQLLKQSANVITDRLKTYGLETTVSILSDKSQIKIQLPYNVNVSEIEGLLTTKGDLDFYETLTLTEINDLLKNKNHQELLKIDPNTSPSDAKLGCSNFENQEIVDTMENCLKSINLLSDYRLLWGLQNSKSMSCLYALKTNAPLTRSDIETIESSQNKNAQSFTIEIKFKPASEKKWAITTKNSLGKPIAIVIDDKVFYTPVVKTPMEKGLCEITGHFTQVEVNYFLALVNNELLPMELILK
jgi:preprotein translocase subunit SecD